jgi:AcrR family transcriptional regulator
VAPTALYRLFPSKDALVAAYIERAERRYREWFEQATAADGRTPAERILSLFEALAERTRPDICRGCPFMLALTEFPDAEVEAHQSSVRLKQWVRGRLRRLAKDHAASCSNEVEAGRLADHLTLLFEGVYATVQALGPDGPAKRARQLAAGLLRVH